MNLASWARWLAALGWDSPLIQLTALQACRYRRDEAGMPPTGNAIPAFVSYAHEASVGFVGFGMATRRFISGNFVAWEISCQKIPKALFPSRNGANFGAELGGKQKMAPLRSRLSKGGRPTHRCLSFPTAEVGSHATGKEGSLPFPSLLPPPPRVPSPFFPTRPILGGEKIESACVQKLQKWEPQEVDRPRGEGGKHASKSATAHFL